MIRMFDIVFSAFGIIILFPLFAVIYLLITIESRGGGLYIQNRVGKDNKDFSLFKFRSMRVGSDTKSLITIGSNDARMTKTGILIRRFKLDELPQLFNVLMGDMSMVGPRPEVRRYVNLYSPDQLKVLNIRPGITDYASIEYVNENEILGSAIDPEKIYIEVIMPDKILLNMKYIENHCVKEYIHIIFLTFWSLMKKK